MPPFTPSGLRVGARQDGLVRAFWKTAPDYEPSRSMTGRSGAQERNCLGSGCGRLGRSVGLDVVTPGADGTRARTGLEV